MSSLCAETGGYRSYFEAYLRRDRQKKADMVFVDKGALRAERRMVDRGAYTDFLENQLEKVSHALLKAEDNQIRFEDVTQRLDHLENLSARLDILEGRVQALGEPPSLAPLELRLEKAEKATSQLASSSLRHADARNKVVVDAIARLEAKLAETVQERRARRDERSSDRRDKTYDSNNKPPPPPPPQESPNDVILKRQQRLGESTYDSDSSSEEYDQKPLSRSQLYDDDSSTFRGRAPRRSAKEDVRKVSQASAPLRRGKSSASAMGARIESAREEQYAAHRSTFESDNYEDEEDRGEHTISGRVSRQLDGLRRESSRAVYDDEGNRVRASGRRPGSSQRSSSATGQRRRKEDTERRNSVVNNEATYEVEEIRRAAKSSSSAAQRPARPSSGRKSNERVSSTSSHLYLPKERRKSVPELRLDKMKQEGGRQHQQTTALRTRSTTSPYKSKGGFRRDEYIGYRWPDSVTHCGPLPKQRQPWVPAVKVGTPRGS